MKKIGVIILFGIVLIILFTGCFSSNKDTVLSIDGEKIPTKEFMVYLYEQKLSFEQKGDEDIWQTDFDGVSAQEVAKQTALNTLVLVKNSVKQAEELAINLNDGEKERIKKESDQFYNSLDKEFIEKYGLTQEDIYEIMSESNIQQKVYDYVTQGFEASDVDFENYFSEYCEENKGKINRYNVSYIYLSKSEENLEKIEMIYDRLLKGEDFNYLQGEFSQSITGSVEYTEGLLPKEVENRIYSSDTPNISDVIICEDGYYILKVNKIIPQDLTALKTQLKSSYKEVKKNEIYTEQSDIWQAESEIIKNEEVFNAITIEEI